MTDQAYETYLRAIGADLVKIAEMTRTPLDLLTGGMAPWWMPDPNPMPRFRIWRLRRPT